MIKRLMIAVFVFSCLLPLCTPRACLADDHGLLHELLFYVPNRVLDVLDIFRIRVRMGPGGAIGVRATELAGVSYGLYKTVYFGLPGPRKQPQIKFPIGLEKYDGIHVMIADTDDDRNEHGPDYSLTEFGISLQVILVGVDVGIDPVIELADLLAGVIFWDFRGDDL